MFGDVKNIEIAYQVVYQKIVNEENYLKLSEEEIVTQLLNYIENILYLKLSSKKKGKDIRNITLLILPIGIAGLVLPILLVYTVLNR